MGTCGCIFHELSESELSHIRTYLGHRLELVRQGQFALKVTFDEEAFHYNGRNDLIYPISRNARWNLEGLRTLTLAIKPAMNAQLKQRVLSEINYLEISIWSDGGRGDRLEYYIDGLEFRFGC